METEPSLVEHGLPFSIDPMGAWIDLAIVLTLALALVLVTRATLRQHEFDSIVSAAVRESGGVRGSRIALPESMRRGVPQLLALNSRPVLYDPLTVSAQGLAAQGVTHVLSSDPATRTALGESLANSTPIAGLELSTVEREAALRQLLPPGRSIVWLDSRPYRYRPLADAAILEPDTPMVFDAFLDPGHYEFRCEAFAPNQGELTTHVDLPGAKDQRDALKPLAYLPFSYSFEVSGDESQHVKISLLARIGGVGDIRGIGEGRPPRVGFVHRAELHRAP